MKKIKWSKDGNQMLIKTGHKTFDSQTNLISTGNVYANTQLSAFIRSWNNDGEGLMDYETNKRELGHLFAFDIKQFRESFSLPGYIHKKILAESEKREKSNILYCFFHRGKDYKLIVHGYILTDYDKNFIAMYNTNYRYKSFDILNECKKYISNYES